jgi:hypothetical protein
MTLWMRGLSSSLHEPLSDQADAQHMTTAKTWLASVALIGGAGGGAAAGLTATSTAAQPATAARPTAAVPSAEYLQQQIAGLLQEDRALEQAIKTAKLRLAGQVRAGEQSLAALHRRIVAAQSRRAQAPAPATAPASHATTGASGAGTGSGGDGGREAGGDD